MRAKSRLCAQGVAGQREAQEPESGSTEEVNGPEKQQSAQKPMCSGRFCLHMAQGPSNARRGVLGAAIVAVHAAQPEQGGKDAEGRDCVWAWACQTEEEARKKAASNVIY